MRLASPVSLVTGFDEISLGRSASASHTGALVSHETPRSSVKLTTMQNWSGSSSPGTSSAALKTRPVRGSTARYGSCVGPAGTGEMSRHGPSADAARCTCDVPTAPLGGRSQPWYANEPSGSTATVGSKAATRVANDRAVACASSLGGSSTTAPPRWTAIRAGVTTGADPEGDGAMLATVDPVGAAVGDADAIVVEGLAP